MEQNINYEYLEALMKDCPDLLTIKEATSWSPFGKNQLYKLINTNQLRAHYVHGSFMITKSELLAYLLEHCDETSHLHMYTSKNGGGHRG